MGVIRLLASASGEMADFAATDVAVADPPISPRD